MDSIIINKEQADAFNVNKDSYIIISDEIQSKSIEINIMDCKATIIDMSFIQNKAYNLKNCQINLIEIINDSKEKDIVINNESSIIDYNVIDLYDDEINYSLKGNANTRGAMNNINIASICYKNKNKNYIINTVNHEQKTNNEINCFGIVKDESVLNYNVTSLIEKGAKQSVVRQNSNILLFDEKALGKNSPILLIEENDVKASHGSSIGKIDDDTMFYLCSRGLSKSEATNLICLGKVEYLISKIENKEIRENLVNNFKERMS